MDKQLTVCSSDHQWASERYSTFTYMNSRSLNFFEEAAFMANSSSCPYKSTVTCPELMKQAALEVPLCNFLSYLAMEHCMLKQLNYWTCGSGPLLCMARLLVLGKLLVLITIICWIFFLHSETTNRNCDNISIWTKWNLHFVCWPLNFKKLTEIMIMIRDLCQKTSFNVTGPMVKWL